MLVSYIARHLFLKHCVLHAADRKCRNDQENDQADYENSTALAVATNV